MTKEEIHYFFAEEVNGNIIRHYNGNCSAFLRDNWFLDEGETIADVKTVLIDNQEVIESPSGLHMDCFGCIL